MKKTLKQVLVVLCSVSILVYAVFQLSLASDKEIETENTFYSVVNDVINTECYIFRNESLIIQSADGARCYSAENGDKVFLGQELCVTYQDYSDADVQTRINEINTQLAVLEQSTGSYFADLGRINENISDYMMDILCSVSDGDLRSAKRQQSSLLVQMNRRQATVEENGNCFSDQIYALKQEKTNLEGGLTGAKVYTTSPAAGYFYTEVDGYENIFSATALEDLSLKDFQALISSNPKPVINSNAIGKIAKSSKWYIAFVCPRREAAGFQKGKNYTVNFPYSETQLDMTLERSGGSGDGETMMLVFSSHTLPRGFNFTRKQEISVVKSTVQGLKVRTTALRHENGKTGVYVLQNNRVVFKTTEILRESGGFYLVALPDENRHTARSATKLSLHDTVILSGKNLYVGKVLQ
ncbi:MAG: hypothetical protein E7597_04785 [Ruminococcaceae bacterium]|nr:hypothetical protein [Oscillospiraceae bacterium]